MKNKKLFLVMSVILILAGNMMAQDYLEDVHLFQSFFHDATITAVPYGQAGIDFSHYSMMNSFGITAQGDYGINDNIEVGAGWGVRVLNYDINGVGNRGGLNDLTVTGRYLLMNVPALISAGAYATLPVGSEDMGAGRFNFGVFSASRYALENGFVVTGNIGLDFFETTKIETLETGSIADGTYHVQFKEKSEYENSVRIGIGGIYPVNTNMNAIGELVIQTKGEYMMLSGGGEILKGPGRIRAMIGLGLDDGAPDIQIFTGYLLGF